MKPSAWAGWQGSGRHGAESCHCEQWNRHSTRIRREHVTSTCRSCLDSLLIIGLSNAWRRPSIALLPRTPCDLNTDDLPRTGQGESAACTVRTRRPRSRQTLLLGVLGVPNGSDVLRCSCWTTMARAVFGNAVRAPLHAMADAPLHALSWVRPRHQVSCRVDQRVPKRSHALPLRVSGPF